ncbi:MAG: N-acetyl-gamma-glutamyl-phosphate reductase [Sodalis sp.]|nr:MAG: N-acetyl-gamma-glutamyl-phosphate reductase [Sodalis sp.]
MIFMPHLGNFALRHPAASAALRVGVLKLKAVVARHLRYWFKMQGEHLSVIAAEDNLLNGAAAKAVQYTNIRFGYAQMQALSTTQ